MTYPYDTSVGYKLKTSPAVTAKEVKDFKITIIYICC